jgi:hypothetical protein
LVVGAALVLLGGVAAWAAGPARVPRYPLFVPPVKTSVGPAVPPEPVPSREAPSLRRGAPAVAEPKPLADGSGLHDFSDDQPVRRLPEAVDGPTEALIRESKPVADGSGLHEVLPPTEAVLPPPPASGFEGFENSIGPSRSQPPVATDCGVHRLPYFRDDFGDDPLGYSLPGPCDELSPYYDKRPQPTQRPWIEWGRPFYDWGQFRPSSPIFGDANLSAPQILLYGDFRNAVASNNNGRPRENLIASRLNLELDAKITSTERFHTSFQPMNKGQDFTRVEWNSHQLRFEEAFNLKPFTGFFEGDLGAMIGGATGSVLPFDLPISVGFMPLVFQNGIWLEDNTMGVTATIPARNSPWMDIANFDITFFALMDDVTSPAFQGNNHAGRAYGAAGFYEMLDGYIELDYAYLEDRTGLNRGYHNLAAAYTRRYMGWLSNSVRTIYNFGQDPVAGNQTADGALFLLENSIVTADPYLFVPYCNAFIGAGRVQSVARNAAAGGILRNTGILFETDNLTNYPTLDPTGVNTFGGAVGVNMIPATIDRQLVLEYAYVGLLGNTDRNARGDEHGLGMRYQKNLSNCWLFRADAMYGLRANDTDISGARMEWRYKF